VIQTTTTSSTTTTTTTVTTTSTTTTTTTTITAELKVGDFKTKSHGVNGSLYIIGENAILLKGFSYDGIKICLKYL